MQRKLNLCLKKAREEYRRKLESKLRENNIREVWAGMKNITGFNKKDGNTAEGNIERANELNTFSAGSTPCLPTIQPPLRQEKVTNMRVDPYLVTRITDHLTYRPQFVRLGGSVHHCD